MTEYAVEFLEDAKERIKNPANWCQFALARDSKGVPTEAETVFRGPDFRAPCKWCASGALNAAFGVGYMDASSSEWYGFLHADEALDKSANFYGFDSIEQLNDQTNHDTVMKAYDKAIRIAKEEL